MPVGVRMTGQGRRRQRQRRPQPLRVPAAEQHVLQRRDRRRPDLAELRQQELLVTRQPRGDGQHLLEQHHGGRPGHRDGPGERARVQRLLAERHGHQRLPATAGCGGAPNFQPVLGDPKFVNAAGGDFRLRKAPWRSTQRGASWTSTPSTRATRSPRSSRLTTRSPRNTAGIRNANNRMPDNAFFGGSSAGCSPASATRTRPQRADPAGLRQHAALAPRVRRPVGRGPRRHPARRGPTSNSSTFAYAPVVGERDRSATSARRTRTPRTSGSAAGPSSTSGLRVPGVHPAPRHGRDRDLHRPDQPRRGTPSTSTASAPRRHQQAAPDDPGHVRQPDRPQHHQRPLGGPRGVQRHRLFTNPTFFNLPGKLSLDSSDQILTINIGAAGLTLNNDEYRLILWERRRVIKDSKGTPSTARTPRATTRTPATGTPLGRRHPGALHDTSCQHRRPGRRPGTFELDPSTDSNVVGDTVTTSTCRPSRATSRSRRPSSRSPG